MFGVKLKCMNTALKSQGMEFQGNKKQNENTIAQQIMQCGETELSTDERDTPAGKKDETSIIWLCLSPPAPSCLLDPLPAQGLCASHFLCLVMGPFFTSFILHVAFENTSSSERLARTPPTKLASLFIILFFFKAPIMIYNQIFTFMKANLMSVYSTKPAPYEQSHASFADRCAFPFQEGTGRERPTSFPCGH